MAPALFKTCCDEFTREVNRLRMEASVSLPGARAEVTKIDRDLDKLMKLILESDDIAASKRVMRQMNELDARKAELGKRLAGVDGPPPLLHPSLAELYRARVSALNASLSREDTRREAAEIVRSLVSVIELTPENGELAITLRGDLAAMLNMAANNKSAGQPGRAAGVLGATGSQSSLVAGTRNYLDLLLTG